MTGPFLIRPARPDQFQIELVQIFLSGDFAAASIVIASASEAIHGRSNGQRVDCFVAFAPRNDADGCGLA